MQITPKQQIQMLSLLSGRLLGLQKIEGQSFKLTWMVGIQISSQLRMFLVPQNETVEQTAIHGGSKHETQENTRRDHKSQRQGAFQRGSRIPCQDHRTLLCISPGTRKGQGVQLRLQVLPDRHCNPGSPQPEGNEVNRLFTSTAKILKIIGNCEQRQDSTLDQLQDLQKIADLAGMYDASDVIKQIINVRSASPDSYKGRRQR